MKNNFPVSSSSVSMFVVYYPSNHSRNHRMPAPERLPPPPAQPAQMPAHTTSAPAPSAGAGPLPTGEDAREITEPTDGSGIAQKPVPERADPQQGESISLSNTSHDSHLGE